MNDLSSLGAFGLNPLFPGPVSGASVNPASAGGFNALVDQMLSDPSTATPQNAKLAVAEARQAENLALGGMFADPSSSVLGMGASGLLGGGDLFALPAWASKAASLSGDPQMGALLNLYYQEASLVQSMLMGGGAPGVFNGLA